MDIVIKERKAYYCNLKVILIFLVVYGHLIEGRMEESAILMWQYRFIYSVHIPLFSLLSGCFLKERRFCALQFRNAMKYYVPIQLLVVAIGRLLGIEGLSFTVPVWHLWYLLSLAWWSGICWGISFVEKYLNGWGKAVIILGSMVIACLAGEAEVVNRELSISRTLVFLPYVFIGRFLPESAGERPYRLQALLTGGLAVLLICWTEPNIPITLLYHADTYCSLGLTEGRFLRALCFVIGLGLCYFGLAWTPKKRMPISKVGNDTLWIYILHAPLAALLRQMPIDIEMFVGIAPLLAALLVCFLYNLCRWGGKLCRIT